MARADFERYVGIPYDFNAFPRVGFNLEEAEALNCIGLVHLVLWKEFWAGLSTGMWALEIKADEEFLKTVQLEETEAGDIFVFGAKDPRRKDPGNAQVLHLAINTGQVDKRGYPLFLLHTTDLNGSASTIWPLSRFGRYKRYERLYAIKRHRALNK